MKELFHPPRDCIELIAVLQALSDQTRLSIVSRLARSGELPCGALGETEIGEDAPKSTLSHHFKVLRLSGVIEQRRHGTSCYNSLRHDDLQARFPGLLAAILRAHDRDDR